MNYVKSNAVPLAIGVAVGYFIAKHGGVKGSVAKVTSSVKSAA